MFKTIFNYLRFCIFYERQLSLNVGVSIVSIKMSRIRARDKIALVFTRVTGIVNIINVVRLTRDVFLNTPNVPGQIIRVFVRFTIVFDGHFRYYRRTTGRVRDYRAVARFRFFNYYA